MGAHMRVLSGYSVALFGCSHEGTVGVFCGIIWVLT